MGEELTVSPGGWKNAPGVAFAYRWETCDAPGDCAAVAGAGGSSFVPAPLHAGDTVRARVTATDAGGSTSSYSAEVGPVALGSFAALTARVVVGTARVGLALSAQAGSWLPEPQRSEWQWLRCTPGCVEIDGATGASYVLTAADHGALVRVRQTVSADGYADAAAVSEAGDAVAAGSLAALAAPVVVGTARVGMALADVRDAIDAMPFRSHRALYLVAGD